MFKRTRRFDGRTNRRDMTNVDLGWITNYIWGIADDVLRGVYVRGKYRDVILPMTVLRRLDAVLARTKQAVLDAKAWLDEQGIVDQRSTLRDAAGQPFYNTSKFTLHDLRARASAQQLPADFEDYLDGFSPSVQDILDNFEFRIFPLERGTQRQALGQYRPGPSVAGLHVALEDHVRPPSSPETFGPPRVAAPPAKVEKT